MPSLADRGITSSFFKKLKPLSIFLLVCVYTFGALFALPAYAETVDTFFYWDTSYLSGTITDSYGTYNLSSAYITNYNRSYNITFPSYSSTPISFQYITIDLGGIYNQSGVPGRIDAQLRLTFDTDADFSKVVSGGSFILGLWIQGYRESYDFSLDSVYFESASGDRGSPLLNAQYIGYSNIGAVASRFYLDVGDNFLPLSNYTNMVYNCHWTGNPSSREINFLLSNNSYLEITDPDTGNIEYMRYQNELARVDMEQSIQDLHVDSVDPSNVGSSVADDMSVIDSSGALDLITVDQSSSFISSLIGWGASSLSVCLIGYILFGKKG